MRIPVIGLIVPPLEPYLPPDAPRLYGDRVRFVVEGLGIEAMAADDFDRAVERIATAAAALAQRGADAIALMGTSLSFFRGDAFNTRIEAALFLSCGAFATAALNPVLKSRCRLPVVSTSPAALRAAVALAAQATG